MHGRGSIQRILKFFRVQKVLQKSKQQEETRQVTIQALRKI